MSCHFRGGFEQAYMDRAEGWPACPPASSAKRCATAPLRWLAGEYISSNDWDEGYSLGASMADTSIGPLNTAYATQEG